jgi:hypothetical protein
VSAAGVAAASGGPAAGQVSKATPNLFFRRLRRSVLAVFGVLASIP